MRLSISRHAQIDLDEIWIFIASESGSAETADRVVDTVGRTLRILRRSPYAGRDPAHDLRPGLRSIPSGSYVIFYRIDAGAVRVLRIIHSNRDVQATFSVE